MTTGFMGHMTQTSLRKLLFKLIGRTGIAYKNGYCFVSQKMRRCATAACGSKN
jgi:hypothetical protein